MTKKYAMCPICGYTIEIRKNVDAGDFICPTDMVALIAGTEEDYTEDHATVFVLESQESEPESPVVGQLFYNSSNKRVYVYID